MLRSAQISPAPAKAGATQISPAKAGATQISSAKAGITQISPAPAFAEDRMQAISEIQQRIERERDKRSILSKKYHRGVKIINVVDNALVVITMGLGATGIGILSTVITAGMAAPIVIAMEAGALATGFLSIVCGQVSKKLTMKAEKHEMLKTLADAKLNTISDHISKALKDNMISDKEYSLLLSEFVKFNNMMEGIRRMMT